MVPRELDDYRTEMPIRRIAITGSSGAYGTGVIRAIRERHPDARILGLDIRPPRRDRPDEFRQVDVLDPRLGDEIGAFRPDTVIHLAFVVDPIRDDALMGRINQVGTANLLDAAGRCRPERVLLSSSATVYGAWPDNTAPLAEDAPIRPRREFRYSADKVVVEAAVSRFAAANPDIAVSWTRPSVIYAPHTSNYLVSFLVNAKVIALPGGSDTPLQFVHVDDVAAATLTLLESDARGPFNVSPDDVVTLGDLARLTGRRPISVPFALCRAGSAVWWALSLPWFRSPAGIWYFIRYPWMVTSRRLVDEFGFRFRYSGLETVQQLLAAKGLLQEAKPAASAGAPALAATGDAMAGGSQSAGGRS
jgi:UDP-glucose 4-epimerase